MMKRKILGVLCLGTILFAIGFLFWKQEIQYLLPTPIPSNYQPQALGEKIDFSFKNKLDSTKATLVHFYNPHCPCSKFNFTHYQELYKEYKDQINFVFVYHTGNSLDKQEQQKIQEDIQEISDLSLYDEKKKIAKNCGVYSTPQAVLLTPQHTLFYRGNYNKARYCTTADSKYTQQAIKALINGEGLPNFSKLATTPYGCELNKKTSFINF